MAVFTGCLNGGIPCRHEGTPVHARIHKAAAVSCRDLALTLILLNSITLETAVVDAVQPALDIADDALDAAVLERGDQACAGD